MKKSHATFYSLLMVFSLSACGSASLTLEEGLATAQGIQNYQNSENFNHPNNLTISLYTEINKPLASLNNPLISEVTRDFVIDMNHSYFYSYTYSYVLVNTIPAGSSNQVRKATKTTTKQWVYLDDDVLYTVDDSLIFIDDDTVGNETKTYQSQIIDVANDSTFTNLLASLYNYYTGYDALNYLIGDSENSSDGYFDEGYVSDNRSTTIKSEGDGSLETEIIIKKSIPPYTFNYDLKAKFSNYYLSSYFYYWVNDYQYSKTKLSVSHETNRSYPNLNDYTLETDN